MSHTFSNNIFHIIFSTKGRIGLINQNIKSELYKYICGIARNENCPIIQVNGIDNHVHMLVKIKPSLSVSDFVSKIKANSSKWISEKFQLSYGFQWQGGYSSFSVSKSQIHVISRYIENQEDHHKGFSFEEEIRRFLKKNEIPFEEKRFLD